MPVATSTHYIKHLTSTCHLLYTMFNINLLNPTGYVMHQQV